MIKWLLIVLLGGALLLIAFFIIFALMVWNHERGYPKAILSEKVKGTCYVSQESFVFLKTTDDYIESKILKILPRPENVSHIYGDYIPGTFLKEDGSDITDLTDAIHVPAGTRFILKDGFHHRTLNSSRFYFWLEPETISLDSSYFYQSLGMTTKNGETHFYTDEEMGLFPQNDMFVKAEC